MTRENLEHIHQHNEQVRQEIAKIKTEIKWARIIIGALCAAEFTQGVATLMRTF